MIFPTLALWSSDAESAARHAAEQIDRSLEDRQYRLATGLAIDESFQCVQGCLMVTEGRGRFLRFQYASGAAIEIPQGIRDVCQSIASGDTKSTLELSLVLRDLAEVQAAVIQQLKTLAGKYVDRILAVAVLDPGVWDQDFDGSPVYRGFCNAHSLAESSGVNVIDEFPARDLLVGGSGSPLESLPIWMLFADRSRTVASRFRSVVVFENQRVRQFDLPPSDGLDSEVPEIGYVESSYQDWIEARQVSSSQAESQREWILAGDPTRIERVTQLLPHPSRTFASLVGDGVSFGAIAAATLGLFHIDQLPANVTDLTGATSQRILGRLTPGRPSNWRQLIRAMAQYHPEPMKLRDAV